MFHKTGAHNKGAGAVVGVFIVAAIIAIALGQ